MILLTSRLGETIVTCRSRWTQLRAGFAERERQRCFHQWGVRRELRYSLTRRSRGPADGVAEARRQRGLM
jgi:hypothetical protein